MSEINKIIRARKSVYPLQFIDKEIPNEIIWELLENANHAPTHRLTEPWRFKVFKEEGKRKLGDFLANKYKEITPDYNPSKFEKIKGNTEKSGAVIALILHRDPQERVPEWEEIAAISCSVQNIWLGLNQYDLGGYWSTPALTKYLGEIVDLKENESCIGFFYLGYCNSNDRIIKKKTIKDKVEFIEE
ncbi:MAG: nitroreductase [Ekhidna sp.]